MPTSGGQKRRREGDEQRQAHDCEQSLASPDQINSSALMPSKTTTPVSLAVVNFLCFLPAKSNTRIGAVACSLAQAWSF